MAKRVTMADVAQHAGVSLKTVSRVVNQEPHVSSEILRRVQTSINVLGFRRNEAARRLASGMSMLTIGLVIENISNEFYSRLAGAVESAAAEHDALVVFGSYEERGERERMLVESMFGHGVDALIIVPGPGGHSWLAEPLASGLTAVFVDRVPDGIPGADGVVLDNATGGRMATEHLLAHGHRRIGLVSDAPQNPSVHARAEGYRKALRARGVTADESLVVLDAFDPAHVQTEVTRLLTEPNPPTAFFATNNRAAIGVLQTIKRRPDFPSAALVGFDDFSYAEVFSPGVTVVRYDISQLGRTAVELLLGRIRTPGRRPQQVTLPVELVVRGSGENRP